MNIYQRIALILGAIALFIFLWISFKPVEVPAPIGTEWWLRQTTYEITLPVLIILLRTAGIIVLTLFAFLVLRGIGKKESK